jgi:hypothetical protein
LAPLAECRRHLSPACYNAAGVGLALTKRISYLQLIRFAGLREAGGSTLAAPRRCCGSDMRPGDGGGCCITEPECSYARSREGEKGACVYYGPRRMLVLLDSWACLCLVGMCRWVEIIRWWRYKGRRRVVDREVRFFLYRFGRK